MRVPLWLDDVGVFGPSWFMYFLFWSFGERKADGVGKLDKCVGSKVSLESKTSKVAIHSNSNAIF
jgi:hypothetical protein